MRNWVMEGQKEEEKGNEGEKERGEREKGRRGEK